MLPHVFADYFRHLRQIHNYNTRQCQTRELFLPTVSSNFGKKMLSFAGTVLTLFRLGVLEILYDWGGVECARAVCLFISQQFLTIELSFKFV